jgi:hypothetical protein
VLITADDTTFWQTTGGTFPPPILDLADEGGVSEI